MDDEFFLIALLGLMLMAVVLVPLILALFKL